MTKLSLIVLLFTTLLIAGCAPDDNLNDASRGAIQHGLPWQIELDANGNSRVFDLQLGVSTFAEAIERHSRASSQFELAILAKTGQESALEAYNSYFRAGPIQGKLILVLATDAQELALLQQNAASSKALDNGTHKHSLGAEGLQRARQLHIRSISLAPAARLDAEMLTRRFGQAQTVIQTSASSQHYLYPAKGLDILVDSDGKDLLQYVAPKQFFKLQENIERQGQDYRQQQ